MYPLTGRLREDALSRIIGPEDIRVLIFTCNRRDRKGIGGGNVTQQGENYVYQMLSSLWMSDPLSHALAGVDLLSDDENLDYLWWFYRDTEKVTIHPPTPEMREGMDDQLEKPKGLRCMGSPHLRLTRNYCRALQFALDSQQRGFLICEDDVVFVDGFWTYAMDAINEMRCTKLREDGNTLTFYSTGHYKGIDPYYRGRYFCSAGGPFAGLCGIYYDRECVQSLLEYLQEHELRLPADLLYAEWTEIHWTRYGTPTGLIQHVGGVSAGTSGGSYWNDARFGPPTNCWDPGWVPKPYEPFTLGT
jgi:hypothetical protein